MNSAVASVLNKVLGDWLEGLDSESLDLSLLRGSVRLGPIRIRTDAIDQLGFPFLLRHGYVKSIAVTIPWTSLTSKPMKIELEGIYMYISPRARADWSPETELRNQQFLKRTRLANFEVLNREQLPDDPGFVQRLITKIIANLQITVSGVYIRYEDRISSVCPFAAGFVMKKMQAVTCTDQWVPEFIEDAKVMHKLVRIEGVATFMDYGPNGEADLPNPKKSIEKDAFEYLAALETDPQSSIPHKYLLHPAILEMKLVLNQDPTNRSIPQANVIVTVGATGNPIKVGFETPMATHIIKCGAFFNEFRVFQTGVFGEHTEGVFSKLEGEKYRELYMRWRQMDKKKADKLLPELDSFERSHTYEDISKQRRAAVHDFEMAQIEAELEAKRKQLSAPVQEGRLSRLGGYVWGTNEDEKKKKEAERLSALQAAEEELRRAKESRNQFRQELAVFVQDQSLDFDTSDDNWNRFKVKLVVNGYEFFLGGETHPYMHMKMRTFDLEAVVRASSMTVNLGIAHFAVKDEFVRSEKYPMLLESEGLTLHYNKPTAGPAQLELDTKQMMAVANVDCLLGILAEFIKATSGLVDVSALKETASSRSEPYIKAGKKYMKQTLSGKYERRPLQLNVHLAAPCFFIPLSLSKTSDLVAIDLGELTASSVLAPPQDPKLDYSAINDEGLLYDSYQFSLQGVEISTVWDCASIDKWKLGKKTPLFKPDGFKMEVRVNSVPTHPVLPAIVVKIVNSLIPVEISEVQLCLLLLIKESYMDKLASILHKPVSELPQEQAFVVHSSQPVASEVVTVTSSAAPRTIISSFLQVSTELFCINIILNRQTIFEFKVEQSLLAFTVSPQGSLILDFKIKDIYANDMREGIVWKQLLGDPNIRGDGEIDASEEHAFLKYISQEGLRTMHNRVCCELPTNNCDFSLRLGVLDAGKQISGLIRLGDMCVIANPDSLRSLLEVPKEAFRLFEEAKTPNLMKSDSGDMLTKGMYTNVKETIDPNAASVAKMLLSGRKIDVKLVIDCAEMRLPLDSTDPNSKLLCFYIETDLLFRSDETYKYFLSSSDHVIRAEPVAIDREARIDIYQMGMTIGYEVENQIRAANSEKGELMKPCRLNVTFSQNWTGSDMRHIVELSLETFDLILGFRDVAFFMALQAKWLEFSTSFTQPKPKVVQMHTALPAPSYPSVFLVDFKSECLQLDLCDDTRAIIVPLARSQVGNLSAEMAYSQSDFTLSFTGSVESSYYNSFVASWEPLLEFWTFELLSSPKPVKRQKEEVKSEEKSIEFLNVRPLAVQFKSVIPMRLNVTYSMVRTLSVVMNTFKTVAGDVKMWLDEQHDTAGRGSREIPRVMYKIKNRTGERVTVRIEGPKAQESADFTFELHHEASRNVAQSTFETAAGRTLGMKKYSSLLQTPQTPSLISIDLPALGKVANIPVDRLGLFAYQTVTGGVVIIEVAAKSSHITITVESVYKVVNNTDIEVVLETTLERHDLKIKSVPIPAGRAMGIPIIWTEAPRLIHIRTNAGLKPLFADETNFQLADAVFAVADSVDLKTSSEDTPQHLVLLNPPITVQNFLPCVLEVKANSSEATGVRIDPGQKVSLFHVNPTDKNQYEWTLDLGEGRGKVKTKLVELTKEEEHFALFGDLPCDKLSFKYCSKAKFNGCEECDIEFRPLQREDFKGASVQVYNQYWIVNHSGYTLDFTGKKGLLHIEKHSLGMVKCKQSSLTVRLAQEAFGEPSEFSQKFNITTTGLAGLIRLPVPESARKPGNPAEVFLGVLIQAGAWPILNSTLIHIYPRYVLANQFNVPIFVRQHSLTQVVEIAPNSTFEYQLENGKVGKCVEISMGDDQWSSPFSLDEIEDFQVRFAAPQAMWTDGQQWWQPGPENHNRQFVRVVVATESEATLFVTFLQPVDAEIYIKNESETEVVVKQAGSEVETKVAPGSKVAFAYDNRMESVKKVMFRTASAEQSYVLDKIKNFQKLLGDLSVVSQPEMSSRIVIIRKVSNVADSQQEKQLLADSGLFSNIDFSFFLPGFELSLHDEVPAERFLFTVAVMQLKAKQRVGCAEKSLEKYTQHSLKISVLHVQLDNMSANPHEFPIIFGGTDKAAAISLLSPSLSIPPEATPFFQFGVIKDHVQTVSPSGTSLSAFDRFVYVNLTLQEMQVRVHQETVMGLLGIARRLQAGFSATREQARSQSAIGSLEAVCPALAADSPVLKYDPGTTASKVYLRMLQMNAMKVILSFKTGRKRELVLDPRQAFGLLGLLSSVGSAFINISDSTLHFSSVIVCDSFQTLPSIATLVVKNYIKQGVLQFYKIIGSSDLIGNPIGLIDKLGTGVFEFFSEPVKGLMSASPKKFAKGLGKGMKSLVSGVVSGSFGSVSKITGSLYTVVREIGGDEESANRINASDNVAEGLYHGVKGGIVDLTEGVTGIFTKPWQGAKRGGMTGFLKGVSSGLVGAVTAPLSAVLRVSTSVTSSVVAQTQLLEDKVKQQGRMRFARQFSARKVMEAYNHELAQAQDILHSKKEFTGEELVFYMRTGNRERVLVTQGRLFYVVKDEVEFECRLENIYKSSVAKYKKDFRLLLIAGGQLAYVACESFQRLAKLHYALEGMRMIGARSSLIT